MSAPGHTPVCRRSSVSAAQPPISVSRRVISCGTRVMQIIEMQTSRIDEVEALIRELRDRLDDGGASAPRRGTMTADGDREGFYLSVIEFDSYEAAMENSNRPEVGEYAARLAKLCDVPPRFYTLDVRETWQPQNR